MPLKQITRDTWRRSFSRILWNGPPLTGKTTGTLTLPRPCHLLVAPGELGYSSVEPTDDYHIYAWDFDPALPAIPYAAIWAEIRETVTEILTGKRGEVASLVIDGLHKLYDLVMRVDGWTPSLVDDKESGKQYTKYHATFGTFLARVLGSGIPLVGATAYDGLEAIDPENRKAGTQIYPMLPGKMAKEIMGMFPVVFHTAVEGQRYYWTLRAQGKMQAAGMHIPTRYLALLPDRVEVTVDKRTGAVGGGWKTIEEILAKVNESASHTQETKQP